MNLIVAMSRNFVIGRRGKLPGNLPSEMKRFKELTTGNVIVMGRRTGESLGKPLPNRENIVLSSTLSNEIDAVSVFKTLPTCIEYLRSVQDGRQVFIIGGAEIYAAFMPYITKAYITTVDTEIQGADVTKFPDFEFKGNVIENEFHEKDEKNRFDYRTIVMEVITAYENPTKSKEIG